LLGGNQLVMPGLKVSDYETPLAVTYDHLVCIFIDAVNGDLHLRHRQTTRVQRCPVKNSGRRFAVSWHTPQINSHEQQQEGRQDGDQRFAIHRTPFEAKLKFDGGKVQSET
jgi:hypothetical protein